MGTSPIVLYSCKETTMNFLAHAYLSFGSPEVLAGNMIGDFVKGIAPLEKFPFQVLTGIRLHRALDTFTDHHVLTRKAGRLFEPGTGRYGPAFVDLAYDHFLACDPVYFPGDSLLEFSLKTYRDLEGMSRWWPERFARMFPYMKNGNWLWDYRNLEGIHRAFVGLVHRARYLQDTEAAIQNLEVSYDELRNCFTGFFPDALVFARQFLEAR